MGSCGKVISSVMSGYPSTRVDGMGSYVTIRHDALDLPGHVQTFSYKALMFGKHAVGILLEYFLVENIWQNVVSAQSCVRNFKISLVPINFLGCNFKWWSETP